MRERPPPRGFERDADASRDSWAARRTPPRQRERSRSRDVHQRGPLPNPERHWARSRSSSPRGPLARERADWKAAPGAEQEDEAVDSEEESRIAAQLEAALTGRAGAAQEEDEEQRLIEERRRRRAQIMAQHAQRAPEAAAADEALPPLLLERQLAERVAPAEKALARPGSAAGGGDDEEDFLALSGADDSDGAAGFELFRSGDGGAGSGIAQAPDASGIGEARDDELERRLSAHEAAVGPQIVRGDMVEKNVPGAQAPGASLRQEPTAQVEKEEAEEEADIFASTPTDVRRKLAAQEQQAAEGPAPGAAPRGLLDNYDDAEGYYQFQVGERIGPGYEVFATHGRGVFSSVLRARDLTRGAPAASAEPPAEVAIKVIRANETMYKAGQTEKVILRKLAEADPQNKRHCVRMLSSFEYRNHLCLVFEPLVRRLEGWGLGGRKMMLRSPEQVVLLVSAAGAHRRFFSLFMINACMPRQPTSHLPPP